MISKNYKVLEVKEGREYVFDSFAFKTNLRRFVTEKKAAGVQLSVESAKTELADKVFTSVDSVTNWMYGRNGVAELDTVKALAEYLGINYTSLLRIKEDKDMIERKDNMTMSNVDMDKTKDVIRSVYQKMAIFMDVATECVRFDYSREFFEQYEHFYKEAERALHLSLLDIPKDIYMRLEGLMAELKIYMYGIDHGSVDIWETSDYGDFLAEKGMDDSDYYEALFMERKSEEFYACIRDILKDYITVS